MKNITIISLLCLTSFCAFAQKPAKMNIWPDGKMPGSFPANAETVNEKVHITNVSTPTLEFYFADTAEARGLVVVCPGGSYRMLAYSHEGVKIAQALQKNGINAAVLKYRVPEQFESALMDSQRAVRLVRSNAKKWNIDADKIAIMGFSAGGNLAARTSTCFEQKSYEAVDSADEASARPNLGILIYPAWVDAYTFGKWSRGDKKNFHKDIPSDYSSQYEIAGIAPVGKNTPPCFIAQSQDDVKYINSAIAYYLALKNAGIDGEIHLYPKGGHGFGLNTLNLTSDGWFNSLVAWLKMYKFNSAN